MINHSKATRKLSRYLLLMIIVTALNSCSNATYYKLPVTKSRKHFRPYDDKKDRKRKRTKQVRLKSLKHTKKIREEDQ